MWRYFGKWTAVALLFIALFSPRLALAQAISDQKAAAEAFLDGIDGGDLGTLYDKLVASRAKQFQPKAGFIQSVSVFRIQSGGQAQSRLFVGGTALTQLQNGLSGDFYYVRYRESYPSAQLFWDITLEHEGQSWLVLSYAFSAVPPGG